MRSALAAFAVVLSTLLVPIGITATWLSLRVDNTEAYVDTVAPLAEEPELREALAKEVADTAIATLESNVPLGLLPGGVDTVVRRSTEDVIESDSFPEFWRQANADAHKEFLAIAHDRDDNVVADGYVIVDLQPLLDDVLTDFAAEFGIPANLVPSTPLPLPVVRESRLEQARGAYQVLDALAWWVPLLWAGLVALAVLVAPGHPRPAAGRRGLRGRRRGRRRTGPAAHVPRHRRRGRPGRAAEAGPRPTRDRGRGRQPRQHRADGGDRRPRGRWGAVRGIALDGAARSRRSSLRTVSGEIRP